MPLGVCRVTSTAVLPERPSSTASCSPEILLRFLLLLLALGAIVLIPAYFLKAEPSSQQRPQRIAEEDILRQDQEIERRLRSLRSNGL